VVAKVRAEYQQHGVSTDAGTRHAWRADTNVASV
jgi:hypothetical protein